MSAPTPQVMAITIKQRIFIAALAVISVLLSALVLFCFSPAGETSEASPCRSVLPAVYQG
jgi:hypothetical protein